MPELPEVETTRRGIMPHLLGQRVTEVVVRQASLRQAVTTGLDDILKGQALKGIVRRGKYLLFEFETGCLIVHLGMSGSLRVLDGPLPAAKHEHADVAFSNGLVLRYKDPRRFGTIVWTGEPWAGHPLLRALGPEPLNDEFNGELLYARSRNKNSAVKLFIMDSRVVVGVGNIYASESLFYAGIRPAAKAKLISRARYAQLAAAIKDVLRKAITQGGTTLRDFTGGDGQPGYFAQQLAVYGREGEPCLQCGGVIKQVRLGQRASYYCPHCQG